MEGKNYFEMKKFSTRFNFFCFIDVSDYLADVIFIKHKIRVWFKNEYGKNGTEYKAIFCKIKKKDKEKFLLAMKELEQNMLLLGYNDYSAFCKELQERMDISRR